jgi:hypothetical protein
MTEQEWLDCTETWRMLGHLPGKESDRKLRLFALACCGRVSHLLQDEQVKQASACIERYAEGAIKPTTLRKRLRRVEMDRKERIKPYSPQWFASLVIEHVVTPIGVDSPDQCAQFVGHALSTAAGHAHGSDSWMASNRMETAVLCHLLRDICGNPFRTTSLDPALITPTVRNLAAAAYEERSLPSGELDPHRLAVLADALEEAGCASTAILDHLRSAGPHVLGCWPVDGILAKGRA